MLYTYTMRNYSEKLSPARRLLPIVIALLAIAVVVFLVAWRNRQSQELIVDTYTVEPTVTPTLFPANLPLEEDAPILENSASIASDGRLQSTRVFETERTLEENSAMYQAYFVTDGWIITAYKNQENYKALFAKKGVVSAQVVLTQDAAGIRTVQVSILTTQPTSITTTTQN